MAASFRSQDSWTKRRCSPLEHRKNSFEVCIQRGKFFAPFLTNKWDLAKKNYDLKAENSMEPSDREEHCKLFMAHIVFFLPETFWNHRIQERFTFQERSKCLKDLRETLDSIFNIETSAVSFLDLALTE